MGGGGLAAVTPISLHASFSPRNLQHCSVFVCVCVCESKKREKATAGGRESSFWPCTSCNSMNQS